MRTVALPFLVFASSKKKKSNKPPKNRELEVIRERKGMWRVGGAEGALT